MDSSEPNSEEIYDANSNPADPSDNDKLVKESDCRIYCSNSSSLDNILNIAVKNITEFSESICSESEKSQFVTRAIEVFKNNIQDNVYVNGLPYTVNKEFLSPVKKKEQEKEAMDTLLAKLAKKVEEVAEKRKNTPKEFCRISHMRLQIEKYRVKNAKIVHSVQLPEVKKEYFHTNSINIQKLKKLKDDLETSQNDLALSLKELKKIKQNMNYVGEILSQKANQEILQDTGYNSS